jgi:hypothetical protein
MSEVPGQSYRALPASQRERTAGRGGRRTVCRCLDAGPRRRSRIARGGTVLSIRMSEQKLDSTPKRGEDSKDDRTACGPLKRGATWLPNFLLLSPPGHRRVDPVGKPRTRVRPAAGAPAVMGAMFGDDESKGIVVTVSDFGSAGDRPTNPELLDYLTSCQGRAEVSAKLKVAGANGGRAPAEFGALPPLMTR